MIRGCDVTPVVHYDSMSQLKYGNVQDVCVAATTSKMYQRYGASHAVREKWAKQKQSRSGDTKSARISRKYYRVRCRCGKPLGRITRQEICKRASRMGGLPVAAWTVWTVWVASPTILDVPAGGVLEVSDFGRGCGCTWFLTDVLAVLPRTSSTCDDSGPKLTNSIKTSTTYPSESVITASTRGIVVGL